ncbi:unnamed protein product [Cyclocybe aegerita]|uniref:Uncharacterized protein n=1 Tax=Cyclocybe aegerita TaxID=1973307 RepID=A0A8S0W6S6_CYCAE|nr:unnamed protein product [Cyclocybe aegerita]
MQTKGGENAKSQMLALAFLAVASLYLTWSLLELSKDVSTFIRLNQRKNYTDPRPFSSYSFVGTDYPHRLPISEKFVKTIAQESVHFAIHAPEAKDEWLWTATLGDGHVRIGDNEQRMFAVAMFHELHCLRSIREVIDQGWDTLSKGGKAHILHCYNYLRQYTLCRADVTLEPGDFTLRNFTKERTGATHTCVDWVPAYNFMRDSWFEWDRFRIEHGIPVHGDVT